VASAEDISTWAAYREGQRDAAALDALFARHETTLVKVCVHLTGDGQAARDLYQDTVVRLLASRPEINDSFPGYFVRAATRIWLNTLKRRKRTRPLSIDPPAMNNPAVAA
jgi:DNA-directed RNA polymerase specialized sigma24 family protein